MHFLKRYMNPAETKIIITALAGSFGLTTVSGNLWQLMDVSDASQVEPNFSKNTSPSLKMMQHVTGS